MPVELFYQTADIYSQFHPCKFTVDEVQYNCCEQYMMHQKVFYIIWLKNYAMWGNILRPLFLVENF